MHNINQYEISPHYFNEDNAHKSTHCKVTTDCSVWQVQWSSFSGHIVCLQSHQQANFLLPINFPVPKRKTSAHITFELMIQSLKLSNQWNDTISGKPSVSKNPKQDSSGSKMVVLVPDKDCDCYP